MAEQTCAVIANPTKITDTLRAELTDALESRGWAAPLWLETTAEDSGHAMTKQALEAGVDLVITAGGDGTVRIVAGELAESGVAMALIPSGTGNLLARNLSIPLDDAGAIETALGVGRRKIDLIKVTADEQAPQWSAVMAGLGVDAIIMESTDDKLKSLIGSAAYFVAAPQAMGRIPVKITVTAAGHRRFQRSAVLCAIGNVSSLTGGLELLTDADPSDGKLNVLIASPRRKLDWLRMIGRILLRHRKPDKSLDRFETTSLTVEIEELEPFQIDGDSAGECRKLRAEVIPDALEIAIPVPVS